MELRSKTGFCFTPKYANWLNQAEMEFSALNCPCLKQRTGSLERIKNTVNDVVAGLAGQYSISFSIVFIIIDALEMSRNNNFMGSRDIAFK